MNKIFQYPHPCLRRIPDRIESIDSDIIILINKLERILESTKYPSLSAPQIGISKRVFILNSRVFPRWKGGYVFINPELKSANGITEYSEFCPSFPDSTVAISRYNSINIQAHDEAGEVFSFQVEDELACIIQHEFAHLEGELLVDHIPRQHRHLYKNMSIRS